MASLADVTQTINNMQGAISSLGTLGPSATADPNSDEGKAYQALILQWQALTLVQSIERKN